jgi:membrane-associated PAP2 superfamily phosphatase
MTVNHPRFFYIHAVYPFAILVVLSAAIHFFDIDRLVADYFYGLQGHSWVWKGSWLAERVLHQGGRNLSLLIALVAFIAMLIAYARASLRRHQKPLLYLFCAASGSSLLVSVLKALLAVSCPWEFARYGGQLPYYSVIEQLVLRNGAGCFPAAHASAGYAWVAVYFVSCIYASRWRWVGLVGPLLFGLVLGVAQQIRGAHFISHDLWTLAVCWFYCLGLYLFMFNKQPSRMYWEVVCR